MSIFDSIKNAIFGHGSAKPAAGTAAPTVISPAGPAPAAASAAPPATPILSQGSLEAQLAALSAKSAQKLNWQTSIVDLMKLVGLDPSFANRKQLASELGYPGDTADSATMNVWLHKAVMAKLAASGGQVTPELKA
jgi:Domain of unknown function (DUF3597)